MKIMRPLRLSNDISALKLFLISCDWVSLREVLVVSESYFVCITIGIFYFHGDVLAPPPQSYQIGLYSSHVKVIDYLSLR